MQITRVKLALLTTLALAVSLGLIACSDDTLTSPADPVPQTSLDAQWQAQVDALRAEIGDEAMAELAPQLAQARASLGDLDQKHGGQLLLVFEATSFSDADPNIYYEGVGAPLGRHTAYSPFVADFETFEQYGTTYWTAANGDELVADWSGTFTADLETGALTYSGSLDFSGGDGRFATATGSGGYCGDANLYAGAGQIVWYGWIVPGD